MIVAQNRVLLGAPVAILGQDDGSSGSGGGFDWKGLMSSAKSAISTASDAYKSISSGGKPAGATATPTKAPVAPAAVLAPGADWNKVYVFIVAPTCGEEYKALAALYKTRYNSSANKSYQQKRMAGTPLTQSDLVIVKWLTLADQHLKDFISKYGASSAGWPTACVGVKATAGTTGVTATTAVVGLAIVAGIGLVIWKLL